MYRKSVGWPPRRPRSLPYPPDLIRLARNWGRPVHEVDEQLDIYDFLDEHEASLWLTDIDNPPKGPPPPKK